MHLFGFHNMLVALMCPAYLQVCVNADGQPLLLAQSRTSKVQPCLPDTYRSKDGVANGMPNQTRYHAAMRASTSAGCCYGVQLYEPLPVMQRRWIWV